MQTDDNAKLTNIAFLNTFKGKSGEEVLRWLDSHTDRGENTENVYEQYMRCGERRLYKRILTKINQGKEERKI